MSWSRRWWLVLGALVAVRVAAPVVVLAAEGRDLPGFPRFDLVADTGDDAGFYAAAREFMAAVGRLPPPVLAVLALAVTAAVAGSLRLWPRRPWRPWLVAALALVVSLAVSVVILEMTASGAAVFGWPLLWSVPLLPYRALGLPLDYEIAFAFAFPLSLAANAVALVATAYTGLYATGRRAVGAAAAAALAVWPLVSTVVAGDGAWENGTWFVDTGLALYTEPVSTALVASALALLLRPARTDVHLALAGVLLSYATFVKLSNAVVAAVAVLAVAVFLGLRRALPLVAGALSFAPAVVAFWPLGYLDEQTGRYFQSQDAFSLDYLAPSWSESLLFSPRTLLVLLPLAVVGALTLRRGYELALLLGVTLANPLFYSFYFWTPGHPRFLFASLPAFFVLWAAGLLAVAGRPERRRPFMAREDVRRVKRLWEYLPVRALAWSIWEQAPEWARRPLRPALAALRRRRRVHTPRPLDAKQFDLPADAVELDTAIGTLWFDRADAHVTPWVRRHGLWEADVMKLLARTLRPGDVFVDVGANVGFHTVLAAHLVGPTGRVFAVEPVPWTLQLLRANLRRHAVEATVLAAAASDAPGTVRLAVDPAHRSGALLAEQGVEVRAATLDELVAGTTVDVLKVDVEGSEPRVFRGARRLIERSTRLLAVVEFRDDQHLSGESAAEVLELYLSLGFELCLLRRNGDLEPTTAPTVLERVREVSLLNLVLRRSGSSRIAATVG